VSTTLPITDIVHAWHRVAAGATVTLTRNGVSVAELVPVGTSARAHGAESPINPGPYTTAELAEKLGVSVAALARRRKAGKGPPHHAIARRVLYDRREVDAWMASRT
jgi:antitoxin (DNA-binding transcriptional repressor) of toxin-antitoxin stability system